MLTLTPLRASLLLLIPCLLLGAACSRPGTKPAAATSPAPTSIATAGQGSAPRAATLAPTGTGSATDVPSASPSEVARIGDQDWARQALQILDMVDSAVSDYHDATRYPPSTLMYQQLQESAFAGFNRVLAQNDVLWPATQRVKDESLRDQYVFLMGNIGGFMHPTPDLPGDPAAPTLGDRVARSLQNAVSAEAAVRPRLQHLASGR